MPEGPIRSRTALLMPICNEDPEGLYDRVRKTWLSCKREELAGHCDVYLLCDTTDPEIREREEEVYQRL